MAFGVLLAALYQGGTTANFVASAAGSVVVSLAGIFVAGRLISTKQTQEQKQEPKNE
ncbi:MAG: hypothetical protein HQL87_11015 [Magnetococcales bacterium]|nr:hypothetical protein [Magnetococcales bacterium]